MRANILMRLVEACRYKIFRSGFDWNYHGFLRDGAWREAFLSHLNVRDRERILEIHMHGSGVTADITQHYPKTQFTSVDIDPPLGAPRKGNISFGDNRLTCNGGQFDKVVCSMVLHPVSPALKIILLKESRRALRNGGKLYVAEFDAPEEKRQGTYLRGISYEYGHQSAAPHLDGKWTDNLEKAGFTHIQRLQTIPEWHSRVTIMRARR